MPQTNTAARSSSRARAPGRRPGRTLPAPGDDVPAEQPPETVQAAPGYEPPQTTEKGNIGKILDDQLAHPHRRDLEPRLGEQGPDLPAAVDIDERALGARGVLDHGQALAKGPPPEAAVHDVVEQ